jgi:hypothetical protein
MPFKKGQPKIAGRKPGSINKNTLLVGHTIREKLGKDLIEYLLDLLPSLSVEQRAEVCVRIMPYRYPRLNSITISKTPEEQELENLSDNQLIERARSSNIIVLGKNEYEKDIKKTEETTTDQSGKTEASVPVGSSGSRTV